MEINNTYPSKKEQLREPRLRKQADLSSYRKSVRALLWLCVLLFTLAGRNLSAQSSFYKYYDINKIHASEVIKGISKDEKGFVWLATDQGVLRFDGNETTLYFKELPSPYTKKFLKRKNGQLLVLTDFGIKEIIQNEDTTYFQPMLIAGQPFTETLNYPKSIYEDREGSIWIGEVNGVVKINEAGMKRYFLGAEYQSINYHRSFSFTEDAFGHLWIAPYFGRLLSYNKEDDRLEDVPIEYPLSDVTSISTIRGDYLIIGGKEGLLQLKVDSHKDVLEKEFIGGPENISTALTIGADIYIGTWDNGLFYGNLNEKPYRFTAVPEPTFNDILDFYYDEQHNEIWLTGSENIGLLKPSAVRPIGQTGRFRVESLTLDAADDLYYSTGQQIFKLQPENPQKAQEILRSKTTYFDRILAEEDKLWIGDAFGGISYYHFSSGELRKLRDTIANPVSFIYKDKNGHKWFTGFPEEVVKIGPSDSVSTYPEVQNSVVIKESTAGQLFCGSKGRDALLYLYQEAEDRFAPVKLTYTFPATKDIQVEDIAFDSLGAPWLATTEGLLRLREVGDGYKAERVQLKRVDINEPLKAIAIVGDNIWLAFSYALAVYHDGQVIYYNRENGLPSRLLKERCLLVHEDKLYVGTAKGLAQININELVYTSSPRPVFKAISINSKKYPVSGMEKVSFPYGARFQAEFVSLSYPGNSILYQTRLKGVEDSWSEPSPNSSMSVLGFSEGTYTLQVRARDAGYLWSEPLELNFVVATPWFKSWWGMLLFVLGAIILILSSVKIYHFHLIRQKKKLQQIIEERTREINRQKNEIIEQKNKLIQQKEELIEKNNAVFKSQQALSEADLNYLHLKEKQLQDQIEYRNKQITTHTLNIIQKNEMLKELRDQLEHIIKTPDGVSLQELKKMLKMIDESFRLDKDWEEFKLYFEQIYTGFYAKLKVNYPELSNQELRHCALIRLNLSNTECASILGISPNSIKVSRTRLRKKLDLENHQSLTDFVMGI